MDNLQETSIRNVTQEALLDALSNGGAYFSVMRTLYATAEKYCLMHEKENGLDEDEGDDIDESEPDSESGDESGDVTSDDKISAENGHAGLRSQCLKRPSDKSSEYSLREFRTRLMPSVLSW